MFQETPAAALSMFQEDHRWMLCTYLREASSCSVPIAGHFPTPLTFPTSACRINPDERTHPNPLPIREALSRRERHVMPYPISGAGWYQWEPGDEASSFYP